MAELLILDPSSKFGEMLEDEMKLYEHWACPSMAQSKDPTKCSIDHEGGSTSHPTGDWQVIFSTEHLRQSMRDNGFKHNNLRVIRSFYNTLYAWTSEIASHILDHLGDWRNYQSYQSLLPF
jgi:hypothetical protein